MSLESQLIFPRRRIRAACKNFDKAFQHYELHARKAMEDAARAVMQRHGKHIVNFCAAMGTTCFYARYNWIGEESGHPISDESNAPNKSVWRDIQKFERDFVEPYNQRFGHDYDPLRITAHYKKVGGCDSVKLTEQRDW